MALVILLVRAGYQFVRWRAGEAANQKRAIAVTHLLCKGLNAYRQRVGELRPNLEAIVDDRLIDAAWLRNITNLLPVTYDPGSILDHRMPRLTVSVGDTWIAVQGPSLRIVS